MRLTPACAQDARAIAEIYLQAFPESVALFFPRKSPAKLLRLLELSFSLLFSWSTGGVLAQDERGEIAGYCLYSPSGSTRILPNIPKSAVLLSQIAVRLGPVELLKLMANQLLMTTTVRRNRKVPRPQASIVSVAVRPAYQGQGLGTLLLGRVLQELEGKSVGLNVRTGNLPGRRLYSSAGFQECGTRRDLLGEWLIMYRPAGADACAPRAGRV
ncbi:MAG TPA: GNAT family N-acetyltransferase [Limnochordia bacterium]|nr:GNAT family N-acetyltransferase [Limnochordia bacterium]